VTNLVARDKELGILHTELDQALQGQMQVVFVKGEAGIGKTELIQTFVEEARDRVPDLFVATSACYSIADSGQHEPYHPFKEILALLLAKVKKDIDWKGLLQALVEVAPDWVASLPTVGQSITELIRAITRTFKKIQESQREIHDQQHEIDLQRRFVQYTELLKKAAEAFPVLLCIDDLHYSDHASLDLLAFLVDHARDSRIMLVCIYRPSEIAPHSSEHLHPVKRVMDRLCTCEHCSQMLISAFSRADLEQYLRNAGCDFPADFVERLHRKSGGNPLFVQEYINFLTDEESGLVKERTDGVFVLSQGEAEIEIPDSVQKAIEQRLNILEEELMRMLESASVQGERFAVKVVVALLKTPELDAQAQFRLLDDVHQLIRELEAQRRIVKVGGEYQFVHGLVQQVLYQDYLSATQRRDLHLKIASLLEELYGEDVLQHATDLAVHFEHGEDFEKALDYYLQASRWALQILAADDALTNVEAVRRLAPKLSDGEQALRYKVEASINAVEAYYLKAEYEAAEKECKEGEILCEQSSLAEKCGQLVYWRARVFEAQGRKREQAEQLQHAIDLLGPTPDNVRLLGYLHANLGAAYTILPVEELEQTLSKALEIAENHDLADVKAEALIYKAQLAMFRQGRPAETRELAFEALPLAQQFGTVHDRLACHRLIAHSSSRLGHPENALHHNRRAISIARKYGVPYLLHVALYGLSATLRQSSGDRQKSLEAVAEALGVARTFGFNPNRDVVIGLFYNQRDLGLWEDARQTLKKDLDPLIDRKHYKKSEALPLKLEWHLAHALGDYEEAVAAMQAAIDIFDRISPDDWYLERYRNYQAMSLIEQGDLQQATTILGETRAYWEGKRDIYSAISLHGLGRVAVKQKNPDQAVEYLQQALELVGGYCDGDWPVWPYAYLDLAQAQLAQDKPYRALESAEYAYCKFKEWGHYLFSEAAFVIGGVYADLGEYDEACSYLQEAYDNWEDKGLAHRLPTWHALIKRYNLEEKIQCNESA
jgi:predicted ATPase